ncbi:MAG: DUF4998 domain-containing protein [Prevotellaceae bacterium]|nr:DUF4998 domain-containing protein [Prevotellaceae bacterium]
MKTIIKFLIPCFCLFWLAGCEDMNSVNQEYLDQGETFYTGKVNALQSFPGNNRIKFLWNINSDPRIVRTVIYWEKDDGLDSTIIAVNRTQPGVIAAEKEMTLPEGNYVFEFITQDGFGHRSIGVERSVSIYGAKYIASLQNRDIASISRTKITWLSISSSLIQHTTVRYVDYTDPAHPVSQEVEVENGATETALSGARQGEELSVTTSYLPVNGLDVVEALPKIYTLP